MHRLRRTAVLAAVLTASLPAVFATAGEAVAKPGPVVLIKNEGNGQYLDVTENDAKPGKPVQTYARNGQENQQWRAEAHLDGSISLRSVANSSLCATAERGTDGYILRLQPCSGRDSQKFHPSLVDEQFALLESHAYRDQALAAKGNNNPATLAKTDPTDKKQHWSAEEVTN